MKAPLALLLCLPFIIWLWKRDARMRPPFSKAMWIPLLWLMMLGSRPLSFWLGVGGEGTNEEGSPFDRWVYLIQIFASMYILSQRGFNWRSLWRENKALALFYGFLLLTALWAASPFVTFRRWFKEVGGIFVTLLVLTEKDPFEAVKAVFARCAYVLYPISVVFIKYFPGYGRAYTRGGMSYTGVSTQKNGLGEIILVFGLLLISELIQPNRRRAGESFFKSHHCTMLIALGIGAWLLYTCNSQTSLVCLLLGVAILLGYKLPMFRHHPHRNLVAVFIVAGLCFLLNSAFALSDDLLRMLGRDPTLTHRTEIWEAVRKNPVDPWIGCGYLEYWDLHPWIQVGQWEPVHINSAHNGYLEIYLDGGIVGVVVLLITLLLLGIRASRRFLSGTEYGRLAFGFYIIMLVYNLSESMYGRRSPLWFAFILFLLNFQPVRRMISPRVPHPRQIAVPA